MSTDYYNTIVRFYDAEHNDKIDDLSMYNHLVQQYGDPILDVGCGTGRVLLHLAQAGYRVHGIDNNHAMLERLAQKLDGAPALREYITYDEADVLTHTLDRKFSLTLLTYNALMHFHEQEVQLRLLAQLRSWTAKDGLLVIDLPNAGEIYATPDNDSLIIDRMFLEPETGHLITLQSLSYLDRVNQLMRAEWFYDETLADGSIKRTYTQHILRYFFFAEMQLLLRQTGFEVQNVYGDTDGGYFEDGSERMIIYATPTSSEE